MSFPVKLAATLTGASTHQLYQWRRSGILVPEVSPERPPMYSFRDLVALRTVVFLRSKTSLQRLRTAFRTLRELDYLEHPSAYRFGTDGKNVVVEADGETVDLVQTKGQRWLFTLDEIFGPFVNLQKEQVVDFRRPRQNLEVDRDRIGGWPTLRGTRIPYDTIASLLADGSYSIDDVIHLYPSVTRSAAKDAMSFSRQVGDIDIEVAS